MGDATRDLMRDATAVADGHRRRQRALEEEHTHLKRRLSQIKTELQEADMGVNRLRNYSVMLGGAYQCPNCWINRGAPTRLVPQPSANDIDNFRCGACNYELSS